MNHKVLDTIEEYAMLPDGCRVVVGVSGGADSVALLHFLRDFSRVRHLELVACHLNHNLRGDESLRDEEFVRRLCREWGIPLECRSLDIGRGAALIGTSVEVFGREQRYAFFAESSGEGGRIATAHTASDNSETVLFNLSRGTGLRGLCGIPPVRDGIVRPLIRCTREEIEEYCARYGLSYITDSSNHSNRYARNRIRHEIIPEMKRLNPEAVMTISASSFLLRQDADYLDLLAEEKKASLLCKDGSGINREGFLGLHPSIASRILLSLCKENGIEPDRRRLKLMGQMIQQGSGSLQLNKDYFLRVGKDFFCLKTRERGQPFFECGIELHWPSEAIKIPLFKGKILLLSFLLIDDLKNYCKYSEKPLKYFLDYDRINKIIKIRQARPKDQIKMPGRNCTKTLKKLFQESGIGPEMRCKMAVVEDESGVCWAEGFGVSVNCAPNEAASRFLCIEILEDDHGGDD